MILIMVFLWGEIRGQVLPNMTFHSDGSNYESFLLILLLTMA